MGPKTWYEWHQPSHDPGQKLAGLVELAPVDEQGGRVSQEQVENWALPLGKAECSKSGWVILSEESGQAEPVIEASKLMYGVDVNGLSGEKLDPRRGDLRGIRGTGYPRREQRPCLE